MHRHIYKCLIGGLLKRRLISCNKSPKGHLQQKLSSSSRKKSEKNRTIPNPLCPSAVCGLFVFSPQIKSRTCHPNSYFQSVKDMWNNFKLTKKRRMKKTFMDVCSPCDIVACYISDLTRTKKHQNKDE